jgi:hypothetical protein
MVWALELARTTYRPAMEDMTSEHGAFIGLDTSTLKISVAIAEGERNG